MYPDVNINGLGNTKGVDSKSKSNNDSKVTMLIKI